VIVRDNPPTLPVVGLELPPRVPVLELELAPAPLVPDEPEAPIDDDVPWLLALQPETSTEMKMS
jgi:hypothetical protein